MNSKPLPIRHPLELQRPMRINFEPARHKHGTAWLRENVQLLWIRRGDRKNGTDRFDQAIADVTYELDKLRRDAWDFCPKVIQPSRKGYLDVRQRPYPGPLPNAERGSVTA